VRMLPTIERERTESAIRRVFEDGCAAWNRGDLDGYLASYWDSEETLWISGGSLTRGKAAMRALCRSSDCHFVSTIPHLGLQRFAQRLRHRQGVQGELITRGTLRLLAVRMYLPSGENVTSRASVV
jgi:hypothetical protein